MSPTRSEDDNLIAAAAEHIARLAAARPLRIAMKVSWWERAVERTGRERWEYLGADDRWHRFWRRQGSIPKGAER